MKAVAAVVHSADAGAVTHDIFALLCSLNVH